MEDDEAYDDLGPGLHVLRDAEPLKRAGSMAAHLRAELCATVPQAQATLAARSTLPPIDVATLATLQVLSRRVARAERVAARTRERAVLDLGKRLEGTGFALAIHPATIRDRATTLATARAALVEADRALAVHAADVGAAPAPVGMPDDTAPADVGASAGLSSRPGPTPAVRRSRSLGAIVASFGLTLLFLGLGLLPLWAALLFPLATSLWALRYLQPPGRHHASPDTEQASSLLAEVSATTDAVFGARREQELAERTVLLERRRKRAGEELRVAERAWRELAGDRDVTDVEAVVKRLDPQYEDAQLAASQTVGVRATDAVLHQFRQRWLAFWRELGMPAPEPADGEGAVDELAARVGRSIVLVGPAAAWGPDLARVAPAAQVLVLEGPSEEQAELS